MFVVAVVAVEVPAPSPCRSLSLPRFYDAHKIFASRTDGRKLRYSCQSGVTRGERKTASDSWGTSCTCCRRRRRRWRFFSPPTSIRRTNERPLILMVRARTPRPRPPVRPSVEFGPAAPPQFAEIRHGRGARDHQRRRGGQREGGEMSWLRRSADRPRTDGQRKGIGIRCRAEGGIGLDSSSDD